MNLRKCYCNIPSSDPAVDHSAWESDPNHKSTQATESDSSVSEADSESAFKFGSQNQSGSTADKRSLSTIMTKGMKRRLFGVAVYAPLSLLNQHEVGAIDKKVNGRLQSVEMDSGCGMTYQRKVVSESSCHDHDSTALGQRRAASSQALSRSSALRPLSSATVKKQLISPVKRANDVNKLIIGKEIEIFTCHKSIWMAKTKSTDGKGLVTPNFELKSELGDGAAPTCSICALSGHGRQGHSKNTSRQCHLHCYSEAISNLDYVYRVRKNVAERVSDKVNFVIKLICLWCDIDLNRIVELKMGAASGSQALPSYRRRGKTLRPDHELYELQQAVCLKLKALNTFYVPGRKYIDACESISSWARSPTGRGSTAECVPVCENAFAMLTGISSYRIKHAKKLIRQGLTARVSKMAQRALRSEARSAHTGIVTTRRSWFRSWLQKTLHSVVQTHANGQKRIQDARFTTAVALARCAIAAYWNAPEHKSLANGRKARIDAEIKKLASQAASGVDHGQPGAVTEAIMGQDLSLAESAAGLTQDIA